MATTKARGSGTKENPWQLTTSSGSSEYQMYCDVTAALPALVCMVGTIGLRYHLSYIADLLG